MSEKSYRQMNKQEREVFDAFYGGFCCALSATVYRGDSGTTTEYLEAVGTVDANELLNFARRNKDPELRRIKQAIRWMKEYEERRDRASRPSSHGG